MKIDHEISLEFIYFGFFIFIYRNKLELFRSQPVYGAAVYRERRYQMLCEYKFSS